MTWWIWVIAGVLLLGMELTFISAEFYLLFVGAAAVVTGLATAACPNCPLWASWSLFIALSLVSVKLFRGTLAERFHVSGLPPPGLSALGDTLVLPDGLGAHAEGRAEFRGASWAIRNLTEIAIAPGGSAQITAIDGLTLVVEPQPYR
ncbi:MAG: NfeD family protein [Pseudomonadota bacterium]|jgi:membrane protein implicated in regulation of membrane protease activity